MFHLKNSLAVVFAPFSFLLPAQDAEEIASDLLEKGRAYYQQAQYDSAWHYFDALEQHAKEHDLQRDLMRAFYFKGVLHTDKTEKAKALMAYVEGLKIAEELQDTTSMLLGYNNLGTAFDGLRNFRKAEEYYVKALELHRSMQERDLSTEATLLFNIANIYQRNNQYRLALEMYEESLEIAQQERNDPLIFQISINLAANSNTSPQHYLDTAHAVASRNNNQHWMFSVHLAYADKYLNTKQPDQAKPYLDKVLELATRLNLSAELVFYQRKLAEYYRLKGDFKNAAKYFDSFIMHKDTIYSQENEQRMYEWQALYESEKKEKEIQLLKKSEEYQALQHQQAVRKQRWMLYASLGGAALLLSIIITLFKTNQYRKKKNHKISMQNKIIAEKNKDITDSINYAKRIQQSILPDANAIQKILPESFIFYRPRDIVSGDFYWFEKVNQVVVFSVLDCTGHGVPGAFMSMMGKEMLEQIVHDPKIMSPSKVLSALDVKVKNALSKGAHGEDSRDGMDMAIAVFHPNVMELQYGGANRPLWLIRQGELIEFAPNKFSIAGQDMQKKFDSHEIKLQKGDAVYIFSDGYPDQFGGAKGKKFKSKQLRELLLSIQDKSMKEQAAILEKSFDEWKGSQDQVDDVCLMGVRF